MACHVMSCHVMHLHPAARGTLRRRSQRGRRDGRRPAEHARAAPPAAPQCAGRRRDGGRRRARIVRAVMLRGRFPTFLGAPDSGAGGAPLNHVPQRGRRRARGRRPGGQADGRGTWHGCTVVWLFGYVIWPMELLLDGCLLLGRVGRRKSGCCLLPANSFLARRRWVSWLRCWVRLRCGCIFVLATAHLKWLKV